MSDTPDILAGLDMAAPPPTAEEHAAFRARLAARRAEEGKPAACTRCLRQIATRAEYQATEGHALRCECDACGPRCFAPFGLTVVCEELRRDRLAKLRTAEDAARDAILADAACLPPGVLARVAASYRAGRRPVVYLAHPVGAATVEGVRANLAAAKRWLWALRCATDWSICAPWIPAVEAVLDSGAAEHAERERGLMDDLAVVERCDGLAGCGGRWSSGMVDERIAALVVIDLTDLGEEPPAIEVLRARCALVFGATL